MVRPGELVFCVCRSDQGPLQINGVVVAIEEDFAVIACDPAEEKSPGFINLPCSALRVKAPLGWARKAGGQVPKVAEAQAAWSEVEVDKPLESSEVEAPRVKTGPNTAATARRVRRSQC